MDGLITLSDLPELHGSAAKPSTRITIGRLDSNLRDPRYGRFSITQTDVDSWKRNLAGVFGGQVSFDFDHSSDRGAGTKAACWISNISQDGTGDGSLITADAQFTKAGAKAVRNGDYRYTSPTFVENYVDEHGVKHGKALIGGALTNRPVLRKGMPCLSLSKDSFQGVAVPSDPSAARRERKRARNLARPRDSRAQMSKLAEISKLLGLDPNADEATILAKLTELKDAAAPSTPSAEDQRKADKKARKLARREAAEGKTMTLSATETAALISAANAGQAAALQLSEQTFTHAWEKALSEGRAAPSQEDTIRALYRENAELAIKTLDSFVQIVPVKPAGSGEQGPTEAPAGMDQDRYQLHTEAKALAARKRDADPNLSDEAAYSLAIFEIEDRTFALANPGI